MSTKDQVPEPTLPVTDSWHVLLVRDIGEDEPYTELLHPSDCPLRIYLSTKADTKDIAHECPTQTEINENGYWGMFGRHENKLELGMYLIAPYVEKIVGPDWTEYDGGWEVHKLVIADVTG